MGNLRPANHSLVQQKVLLRGVGACGLYNCKIATTTKIEEKEKKSRRKKQEKKSAAPPP